LRLSRSDCSQACFLWQQSNLASGGPACRATRLRKTGPNLAGTWRVPEPRLPPTGITAANTSLRRRQVHLDGTVDASAIYLHGVTVKGSKRDVFFVTTNCGKTIALDANGDAILWEYTPPQFSAWVGTAQITNSTPVADADRLYVYAAAPDGTIQKLAISDGQVLWTTPITLLTQREKIASPLKVFRGRIVAVTAGYNGRPTALPGHVAILDAQSGKLLHVWNSLCSDRAGLIQPGSRQSTRSAIWGRAGAVIDEATGNIFIATGNGPYHGKTDWAIPSSNSTPTRPECSATILQRTIYNSSSAISTLGSTSPVLLGGGSLAQGGKDKLISLLSINASRWGLRIRPMNCRSCPRRNECCLPPRRCDITAPRPGYSPPPPINGGGAAWTFRDGKLVQMWNNSNGSTIPIVAGGLLYIM